MSRAKKTFFVFGIFAILSSLAFPLSSTGATTMIERDKGRGAINRNNISVGVGISKMIGLKSVSNTPGEGVDFADDVYSKTMAGGESIDNFGTTTMSIICNFDQNDDTDFYGGYNCRDNGWTLSVTPASTKEVEGVAYAAMVSEDSPATILSQYNSYSGPGSNWAIKVSSVPYSIESVDVSPSIPSAFSSTHIIPATSTEIASGKSWKTIKGIDTYIDSFGVNVQYGINLANSQAAGTYTGAVNYTVSLKAST